MTPSAEAENPELLLTFDGFGLVIEDNDDVFIPFECVCEKIMIPPLILSRTYSYVSQLSRYGDIIVDKKTTPKLHYASSTLPFFNRNYGCCSME